MELITLIGTLEANLTRELVNTNNGDTISYTANTPKTVTINSTTYSNSNRLCLISKNGTTKLYIASYDFKKVTGINITSINSISIS